MLYDWQDIHLLSTNIFLVKTVENLLCFSAEIFVDNGDGDVISVVDKDAWQIFEPVCSIKIPIEACNHSLLEIGTITCRAWTSHNIKVSWKDVHLFLILIYDNTLTLYDPFNRSSLVSQCIYQEI